MLGSSGSCGDQWCRWQWMVPDPETASRAATRAQYVASQDFTLICHTDNPWSADCRNKWAATTQGDRV